MSTSIDQAFVKQYEAEVHTAYQRTGALLRHTIRVKSGVVGTSTTFQKVGKGQAGQKGRHGVVPVMNIDHTNVEVTIADFYAGDWVDKLDEAKTNIDERAVIVSAGAYALGRKTDDIIITAASASLPGGQKIAESSAGLTRGKVTAAIELLGNADVPDDGQRFAIVGHHQWSEMMAWKEFANSDWVGADRHPWLEGRARAKQWLGCTWIAHSGLSLVTGARLCLLFHKSAIGWAENAGITADITWHGDRQAHFIAHTMTGGAKRIDDTGVVEIACDDDAAITYPS